MDSLMVTLMEVHSEDHQSLTEEVTEVEDQEEEEEEDSLMDMDQKEASEVDLDLDTTIGGEEMYPFLLQDPLQSRRTSLLFLRLVPLKRELPGNLNHIWLKNRLL